MMRIEEFANALKSSGAELEVIKGELYNTGLRGINNRVLKNVLSFMVHLKQTNNTCETLLTKRAEPFDAEAGLVKICDIKAFLKKPASSGFVHWNAVFQEKVWSRSSECFNS